MGISLNIMKSPSPKCYMTFWDMTIYSDQTLHQFANLLPNWTLLPILTLLPNFGGFNRSLQPVWLANRGRLLLRTPGPVPFGTCICSNIENILPVLVMSTDLLNFEHPSVLLFCSLLPPTLWGIFYDLSSLDCCWSLVSILFIILLMFVLWFQNRCRKWSLKP